MKQATLLVLMAFISFAFVKIDFKKLKTKEYKKSNLKGKVKGIITSSYTVKNNFGKISSGIKKSENIIIYNIDSSINKKIQKGFGESQYSETEIFEYANGEKKSISVFNEMGELYFKTIFTKIGNDIVSQDYSKNGERYNKYSISSFDERGNEIKYHPTYHKLNENFKRSTSFYFYDKESRLIRRKTISPYSGITEEVFSYGKYSSVEPIKIVTTYDGGRTTVDEIKLNSHGDVLQYNYENQYKKMYYTYTYDKFGNWIKMTSYFFDSKMADRIDEREISYFK